MLVGRSILDQFSTGFRQKQVRQRLIARLAGHEFLGAASKRRFFWFYVFTVPISGGSGASLRTPPRETRHGL
jgi:hypothetical protein